VDAWMDREWIAKSTTLNNKKNEENAAALLPVVVKRKLSISGGKVIKLKRSTVTIFIIL